MLATKDKALPPATTQVPDNDMFEGKYKDVKYTISETRLIYKASKNVSTVFEGVIINFEANKTIKNKTGSNFMICGKGSSLYHGSI